MRSIDVQAMTKGKGDRVMQCTVRRGVVSFDGRLGQPRDQFLDISYAQAFGKWRAKCYTIPENVQTGIHNLYFHSLPKVDIITEPKSVYARQERKSRTHSQIPPILSQ